MIPGIGKDKLMNLREHFGTEEWIWREKKKQELMQVRGIGDKIAEEILNAKWKKEALDEWEKVKKAGIQVIGLGGKDYPEVLAEIYDPPLCFYAKGNANLLKEKNIAIVGSRLASKEALKASLSLSYQLARSGFGIVSGLAKGVDAYAHIGTIRAYDRKESGLGKTIAVVGTGLDQIYPKENAKLQEEILACDGLVMSEFRMESKMNRYHFPQRNRMISGISRRRCCGRSGRKKSDL